MHFNDVYGHWPKNVYTEVDSFSEKLEIRTSVAHLSAWYEIAINSLIGQISDTNEILYEEDNDAHVYAIEIIKIFIMPADRMQFCPQHNKLLLLS